jgi:hypothetical protein
MTSFGIQENFSYHLNPALEEGQGLIPLDASSMSEITQTYQTNTAPRVNGVGEPQSYNGVETLFDMRIPATARVLFNKSFFKITGYGANMAVGANSPVLVGTSIPWNTIAATLETAEVQLNQSATTTEQINQNLGDGSMVKMLTRVTRETLESMDDSFFTPCIESVRDAVGPILGTTYLSPESILRRANWLVNTPGNTQKVHSKNIYLSDLFESLRLPAAFFLQNLQFKIRPKLAADILIKDPVCLGVNAPLQKYFITNITLHLTLLTLATDQLKAEKIRILENSSILRQSFYSYDAIQKTHSQSASYRDANIKNMQAAVFMFPSHRAADGLGINPYQYCYGSGAGGVSGVASYQMKYESNYSPATPLPVSTSLFSTNTEVYAQYRLLCRKMSEREITPALKMVHMATYAGTPDDASPYVLFCAQFYPLTAYGHRTMGGADHEITISGGAVEPIVIVRLRLSFLEIKGDTSVNVIN